MLRVLELVAASCLCLVLMPGPASLAQPPRTAETQAGKTAACSRAYHADLQAIGEIALARISAAVAAARESDGGLPGKWLFSPARRVARDLRFAHTLAATAMRTRGRDPWLRGDNATWLTRKLRNDMERYLDQSLHAGMCAPAGPMLDFLDAKLAQLEPRMGIVSRAYKTALVAARQQSLIALAALAKASTGAVSTRAEILEDTVETAELARIVAAYRAAMGIHEPPDRSRDALADLVTAEDAIASHPAMRKDNELRRALLPGLQAVERAAYLARLESTYRELYGAFADTLAAIRIANKARCTCR